MKHTLQYRLRSLMLPGLKRWIAVILVGVAVIIFGVLEKTSKHPVATIFDYLREIAHDIAMWLGHHTSGLIAIIVGVGIILFAVVSMLRSVLGAYLPEDRPSIPDVLYRRRHLQRGPKIVVIGGGHGLANLLRGLKGFTNNLTAIVTVGDDGGSSGRLRQELGVLPPGDIRNCITALADEDKMVTELFHYRFVQGQGLEGHSFGNLFLTALCAITDGDMLEAARVASRVLNSCGQVLPSTLTSMTLIAQLEDGRVVHGESNIPDAGGRVKRLTCEPESPNATPEALSAIGSADMIVLGPGSLYTSVIPNILVKGIAEAILQSRARKIYVCNLMTQQGETSNYTVSDHVEALLTHAGIGGKSGIPASRFLEAAMVNVENPAVDGNNPAAPVRYDPVRLRQLGVKPVPRPLASTDLPGHHDSNRLATALMLWYFGQRPRVNRKPPGGKRKELTPTPPLTTR